MSKGTNSRPLKYEKREFLIRLLETRQDACRYDDPIAVVGLSGRYPLSETVADLWRNLQQGRLCISEIPRDRWPWEAFYDPEPAKGVQSYSKWGGFIENVDKFDPFFFNISPAEAIELDPQERVFLETAWATLEDAGYTKATVGNHDRNVGVFVGVMWRDYEFMAGNAWSVGKPIEGHSAIWSIANRISYQFGFEGPSMAIDTACSSSLTAVHLACESLRKGECHTAIAGGVNLILHPVHFLRVSKINMLAKDRKCKAFGLGADGFVDGEGVGAILLKPLQKAISAGDHIYGVIKSSAVNTGGKTSGYTVPNPNAQADLVLAALKKAGIDPRTVSYIEAHGTGTSLGDPIEIAGLTRAFTEYAPHTPLNKQYCAIGSIKSNIGHLESAAGIAGLTKVLLQLKHKRLVPSLHTERLNPKIDFENSPFYVQRELAEWKQPVIEKNGKATTYPRRAGISSFGAGGANVHLILEEYNASSSADTIRVSRQPHIIVLSARTDAQLKTSARYLLDFLQERNMHILPDAFEQDDVSATIHQELREQMATILQVRPTELDLNDSFRDYGLDPVHLTELTQWLNNTFNLDLTPAIFSQYPSPETLTAYVCRSCSAIAKTPSAPADYIAESSYHSPRLCDIAYTLQVGREELNQRLALVVSSVEELGRKLAEYCREEPSIAGLYQSHIRQDVRQHSNADDSLHPSFSKALHEKDFQAIAQLWIAGAAIDWTRVYSSALPRRISLPTYPFARDRYWISEIPTWEKTSTAVEQGSNQSIEKPTPEKVPPGSTASPVPAKLTQQALTEHVRNDLSRFLQGILKVPETAIDVTGNMLEYGFDSITMTEYIHQINTAYAINMGIEAFFDLGSPTIETLAAYLCQEFRTSIEFVIRQHSALSGSLSDQTDEADQMTSAPGYTAQPTVDKSPVERSRSAIAIIGLNALLPQGYDVTTFWQQVAEGKSFIAELPQARRDLCMVVANPDDLIGAGAFLDEIAAFDAEFFGYSPEAARMLDPQQRLLLEIVWKTIEDAGYKASTLAGMNVGLFIGASHSGYADILRGNAACHDYLGAIPAMFASRIAAFFDFHGPRETIDTAGSSSLVALHRGVEAIRQGRCNLAIVGGVQLIVNPLASSPLLSLASGHPGILAQDGRCSPFDKQAGGTVMGEGLGAVLLKPLEAAIVDHDHVYAVLKGTTEQYGKYSETRPFSDINGQTKTLLATYQQAQIEPWTIGYIEANGSGIPAEDVMEMTALCRAFDELYRRFDRPLPDTPHCAVGSIKSRVGHLGAAAGMAGLIHVLGAMQQHTLPATLSIQEKHPDFPPKNSPFYLLTKSRPWPSGSDGTQQRIPRRAGLNAFGIDGTQAHIVLEEFVGPRTPADTPEQETCIIVLSAHNTERLKVYAATLVDFLSNMSQGLAVTPEKPLSRIELVRKIEPEILELTANTLQTGENGYEPSSIELFVRQVNERFSLTIASDTFFRQSSIGAFIKYIGKNYREQLAAHYRHESEQAAENPVSLLDMAYTLQVGRKAMDERLAIIASNIIDLKQGLQAYCRGKTDVPHMMSGNVNTTTSDLRFLFEGEEETAFLKLLIEKRRFAKLAYCWIAGCEIEWTWLYNNHLPHRISLPTYPFEKNIYWGGSGQTS